MIHRVSKRSSGYTLIEAIAVVAIIGALVAVFSSTFVVGFTSYASTFEAETRQLELLRARAEFSYYVANAISAEITGGGYTLVLSYPSGGEVQFSYVPDPAKAGEDFEVGSLGIELPAGSYTYTRNLKFTPTVDAPVPFRQHSNGILFSFSFEGPQGRVPFSSFAALNRLL